MALTSVELTHELERAIRTHLLKMREANVQKIGYENWEPYDDGASITMLALFSMIDKQFVEQSITSGFFNKVVADMRRAGIVEIYNSFVRFSCGAWELHKQDPRSLCTSECGGVTCNLGEGHSGQHINGSVKWFSTPDGKPIVRKPKIVDGGAL